MKIIQRLGDVCAEDYGGGAIVCENESVEWTHEDAEGRLIHPPIKTVHQELYLEWTHGLESDHPGEDRYGDEVADLKLMVYRVQLDEPAWVALSGCGDETKLWTDIARSVGMDPAEVIELAKSEDPLKIAGAYEMYAGHWGWGELDHYPEEMAYSEVETRWGE